MEIQMIDKDRIAKAKTDVVRVFEQVSTLIVAGKEVFLADQKNSLALKYLLIEAVEAIADVCQHLLAKTKGVACEGYVDCIVKTGEKGIISIPLAGKLRLLANLRNSLIHRYWTINDEQLYDMTFANKGDLVEFSNQIDSFLASLAKQ